MPSELHTIEKCFVTVQRDTCLLFLDLMMVAK